MIRVRVEGLRELQAALAELPRATSKNIQRRVLKKRAQPIADAARERAPVDEGQLRDSIAVSAKLSKRQRRLHRKFGPDDVEMFVGAGALPQAHLQEFGENGTPFMRPAWEAHKRGVLDGIQADLWTEIQKAAARRARKAARLGR